MHFKILARKIRTSQKNMEGRKEKGRMRGEKKG
jgi:hypothetical protein